MIFVYIIMYILLSAVYVYILDTFVYILICFIFIVHVSFISVFSCRFNFWFESF